MRIYIAGPYSNGNVEKNVRTAILTADLLLEKGYFPYVPHLTHFWHKISPKAWAEWMGLDMEWLRVCDAVLRLPGKSKGADKEVALAVVSSIPVVHKIEELDELKKTLSWCSFYQKRVWGEKLQKCQKKRCKYLIKSYVLKDITILPIVLLKEVKNGNHN
jgi:hypothetical protein